MQRAGNIFGAACMGLMLLLGADVQAQAGAEPSRYGEAMLQARRIRVAKMAKDWKGKRVTLEYRDGRRAEGRMVRLYSNQFVLQQGENKRLEVPVDEVVSVTLHAGWPDILFGGLIGVGLGAVTAGVMELGIESKPNASRIGAVGGFLLGSIFGVRLLHRNTVVFLDPSSAAGSVE